MGYTAAMQLTALSCGTAGIEGALVLGPSASRSRPSQSDQEEAACAR